MKGYKALNNDMTTLYGHMTYDLNKVYREYSELELCKNGFHFCSNLIEVFAYYKVSDCRVFEIDTLDGKVIKSEYEDKYCTDTIKLIREISQEEISQYIEKNLDTLIESSTSVRLVVAYYAHGLDTLINDESCSVRKEVARKGYGLDKLINDHDWRVRREVAKQGYGLDVLIKDHDCCVREAVAEQKYGLNVLVNDTSWLVREQVAHQGYGLEVLINDPDYKVRRQVACMGYGLDVLINDKNWEVRMEVAKQGYGLDKLIYDINRHVKYVAADSLAKTSDIKSLNSVNNIMHKVVTSVYDTINKWI